MAPSALRPLSIGEILDGAFTLYRRHFTAFMVPGLLIFGSLAVIGLIFGQAFSTLADLLTYWIYLGALIWMSSEVVQGREPEVGASMWKGVRKAFPIFTVFMFTKIAMFIGFVFLIVPGIILWLMWFAWAPIVVIEDRWDFFARSRSLARDAWGKIAVTQIVYGLIAAAPGLALVASSWIADPGQFENPPPDLASSFEQPLWVFLSGLLARLLTEPFAALAWVLLYFDMRVRKDGLDVAQAMEAAEDDEAWGASAGS